MFTLPRQRAKARRPETRPWLPRLWLCPKHQHRQCATCATVVPQAMQDTPATPRPRLGGAGRRKQLERAPRGGGGTPLAKRRRAQRQQPPMAAQERAHMRGRTDPTPPPPAPGQEGVHAAARCIATRPCRNGGQINPTPQRFWPKRGPQLRPRQALGRNADRSTRPNADLIYDAA